MLPDLPETLLAEGNFNKVLKKFISCSTRFYSTLVKVPVLVGANSGEGVLNSGRYILR